MSSGSMPIASDGSSSAASGRRRTMPSSPHIDSTGTPVVVGEAALDGHRPRGVDGRAERAEDADPPVADLVAEALDDDRAVVGHDAGGLGLLVEVLEQVARRQLVERGRHAGPLSAAARRASRSSRTKPPTARPSSSGRPGRSPCQNGIFPARPAPA